MQPTSLSRQKVRALIADGEYTLAAGPHPERARRDAETLLLHLFRRNDPERNTAWLISHWNSPTDHGAEYHVLISRRFAGEPMQYITGETEFYGLPFRVTRDVLIPRPETEHLVEKVIELAAGIKAPRIVDVGTGSGAIAVALTAKLSGATITATDISGAAVGVARGNAQRNGVANRMRFLEGEWLAPVVNEQFDIVVSNPPYVAESDRATLDVEVREYEPGLALFAGEDGLASYRLLIPAAHAALVPGGWIALEIGYGQEAGVRELLVEAEFEEIEFTADLRGIKRVATGKRA